MKLYNLIIPMAGEGRRFLNKGYQEYKSFLNIDKNLTLFKRIILNFKEKRFRIFIIASDKNIKYLVEEKYKRKVINIEVKKHKKGPLFSLYLAKNKLKKFFKKGEENIFISYSDIIWNWNIKKKNFDLKEKKVIIYGHRGFHPHIEVNSKSDFYSVKKNNLVGHVKKKSPITDNYKNDYLAIGCYFFRNLDLIINNFPDFREKEEYYIIDLINNLLNRKINVYSSTINSFCHLGFPEQFEDFLKWKNFFKTKNITRLITNNFLFKNNSLILLAGGKGERLRNLYRNKFLMKVNNKYFYKIILRNFNSKKNLLVTNSTKISFKEGFRILIKKNNSMFETIKSATPILKNLSNFFLSSCDCIGEFDCLKLRQLITETNADIVFFGFKQSYLQKKNYNSHSFLVTQNKQVVDINVKDNSLIHCIDHFGHAGFFWIKNGYIFKFVKEFENNIIFKKFKREVIIDDFFKFLIKVKLFKAYFLPLENYLHLGSSEEFNEFLYWKNFFNNKKNEWS